MSQLPPSFFGSELDKGILAVNYRYSFGGIEKSPEVAANVYETDFRLLDSRIGCWLSPDPIVKPWGSANTA